MTRLIASCWIIATAAAGITLGMLVSYVQRQDADSPAENLNGIPREAELTTRARAQEFVTIKTFSWRSGLTGEITANFVFENRSDFDVRSLGVGCDLANAAGKNLDFKTAVIQELVSAQGIKVVRDVNMGSTKSEVTRSKCTVTQVDFGEYRPALWNRSEPAKKN